MNYIKINRNTYDQTAEEFRRKIASRKDADENIINKFSSYFKNRAHVRILDTGPGNGQMAKLLCDKGYETVGIELSKKMAKIAQNTAPKMDLVIDNFLTHDFGSEKFSGILSVAFIHLFPKGDCAIVLKKIHDLLTDDGYALISTTKHDKPEEGLFRKQNFQDKPVHFRKRFTRNELHKMLLDIGFKMVESYENEGLESDKKSWMTFIVKK